MGLDNGVLIKGMPKKDLKKIPYFKPNWYIKETNTYEPIYWRKCYNLRDAVFSVIGGEVDNTFEYKLAPNDIAYLIQKLKPFLQKSYWDNHNNCIWDYEEMFEQLYEELVFLEWFKTYYKENSNLNVTFYDSY